LVSWHTHYNWKLKQYKSQRWFLFNLLKAKATTSNTFLVVIKKRNKHHSLLWSISCIYIVTLCLNWQWIVKIIVTLKFHFSLNTVVHHDFTNLTINLNTRLISFKSWHLPEMKDKLVNPFGVRKNLFHRFSFQRPFNPSRDFWGMIFNFETSKLLIC
jgi:hypothetical protein